MVSVLASCAVDRGFEPQSGQTKDYIIVLSIFAAWSRRRQFLIKNAEVIEMFLEFNNILVVSWRSILLVEDG
jgi:hypothetical protein